MNSTVREVIEWIICIVVAIVLAILIRYFIGTPTEVKMTSMSPTLKPGERLILNKIPITFGQELKRGDIITFERPSKVSGVESLKAEYNYEPENLFSSFVYYVLEIGKDSYIKRLIGLPGDHVQIQSDGVYINEQKLEESYIPKGVITYAKNSTTDTFVISPGCKLSVSSLNQLLAPFIAFVNKTATNKSIDKPYNIGDIFVNTL